MKPLFNEEESVDYSLQVYGYRGKVFWLKQQILLSCLSFYSGMDNCRIINNMKITFVKKILADGSPCKKCNEVIAKMEAADQLRLIDNIVVADESNPDSEGMVLAAKHAVTKAPFFIVEQDDGSVVIHTIYFKFVKEVLNAQ
jgi:hypothetical protein